MLRSLAALSLVIVSMSAVPAAANPALPIVPVQGRAAPPQADDDDPVEKCTAIQQAPRATACLRGVLAEAEKALDALVKKGDALMAKNARVPAPEKEKWRAAFAEAQASWRRFVDLDCDGAVAREAAGDPNVEGAVLACKATAVRARVTDLDTRFSE